MSGASLLHADLVALGLIALVLLAALVLYVLGEINGASYINRGQDYDLTHRIAGRRRRR